MLREFRRANRILKNGQLQHLEEIGLVKEELQEKIYKLESEMKQLRYERDSKETQISALREQIKKGTDEKVLCCYLNNTLLLPILFIAYSQ